MSFKDQKIGQNLHANMEGFHRASHKYKSDGLNLTKLYLSMLLFLHV